MADREGNILRPPGTGQTAEVKPTEILASYARLYQKGRTFKAGNGVIEAGTVVARETATKKYVPYNDAGAGGAEVAKGVLRMAIDTTDEDKLGDVVFGGILKNSKMIGLDAAAVTDLNGRIDAESDTFIF